MQTLHCFCVEVLPRRCDDASFQCKLASGVQAPEAAKHEHYCLAILCWLEASCESVAKPNSLLEVSHIYKLQPGSELRVVECVQRPGQCHPSCWPVEPAQTSCRNSPVERPCDWAIAQRSPHADLGAQLSSFSTSAPTSRKYQALQLTTAARHQRSPTTATTRRAWDHWDFRCRARA